MPGNVIDDFEAPAAARVVGRWPRIVVMACAAIIVVAGSWWLTPVLFDLDDAYIVLHSAQVVASHRPDPIFGTPALTGITSPAYLALVLLFIKAQVPPLIALRLASALGTAALAGAIW